MKRDFEKLELDLKDRSIQDQLVLIDDFVDNFTKHPDILRFLTIEYKWVGYGTWKSCAWANNAFFGLKFAEILRNVYSVYITHDEDKEFVLKEHLEDLRNELLERLT